MPARSSGDQHEDGRGHPQVRSDRSGVSDLVLEFGGTVSGEHGDGLVRSPFLRQMFGDTIYEAFREIKRTFDPLDILNPGKIVDPPPLTSNLRFGSRYTAAESDDVLRLLRIRRTRAAPSKCAAASVRAARSFPAPCVLLIWRRAKKPIRRAGRANVLRLAMSGRLGESGLGDEGVHGVLDLCLECRACKAECPVGVDMARYQKRISRRLLCTPRNPFTRQSAGPYPQTLRLGQSFRAHLQLDRRRAPARWMNEQLVQVDRRRTLPAWKHQTFERWLARHPRTQGKLTLFNDSFTNHYDPEIGIAAVEVLERAGASVAVATPGCCGRPLISQACSPRLGPMPQASSTRSSR